MYSPTLTMRLNQKHIFKISLQRGWEKERKEKLFLASKLAAITGKQLVWRDRQGGGVKSLKIKRERERERKKKTLKLFQWETKTRWISHHHYNSIFLCDGFENGWVGMTPIGNIQSAMTIIRFLLIIKCECNKTNYEQEIKVSQIKSKTFFEYLTATLNFGT